MDRALVHQTVRTLWDGPILDSLSGLITIPAVSATFDANWAKTGHLDAAVEHVKQWILFPERA